MNEWQLFAAVCLFSLLWAVCVVGSIRLLWPDVFKKRPARLGLHNFHARDLGAGRISYHGIRCRWLPVARDWEIEGVDWDAAPPWATALLENTKTSDIIWADGHCTGARMQWIYCTAKTLNGKEFTMTRPEHWRVVEWRPETRQGDQ